MNIAATGKLSIEGALASLDSVLSQSANLAEKRETALVVLRSGRSVQSALLLW